MRLDSAKVDTSTGQRGWRRRPERLRLRERAPPRKSSLFLSDEYGPFVVEVDIPTLRIKREWYPGHGPSGGL
jgi:hypothetical protein